MERDPDSHTVHYQINDQTDNWSYSPTCGTWTAGANNLPDDLEEHNDFDLVGWADTFMLATQCGNVVPDEADTQLEKQNLCVMPNLSRQLCKAPLRDAFGRGVSRVRCFREGGTWV